MAQPAHNPDPETTDPILAELTRRLTADAGDALVSLVLYGPAASGDRHPGHNRFNVLVVVADVELSTLDKLAGALAWWKEQRQPTPRVFSPALIADSADVFPLEWLDIAQRRKVLAGSDPFADFSVDPRHLRLQCEKELREKMMRLREAYIELAGRDDAIALLVAESYSTFVALFRGALRLAGKPVPDLDADVTDAFCAHSKIDGRALKQAQRLRLGETPDDSIEALFAAYYQTLTAAVSAVDTFQLSQGDRTP
ncbi:MAG TPA: hypothetical protein VFG83_11580 [Kofleriaceae bacterium]|nr:hypothetical protein [Kofleriaceae bacterium]